MFVSHKMNPRHPEPCRCSKLVLCIPEERPSGPAACSVRAASWLGRAELGHGERRAGKVCRARTGELWDTGQILLSSPSSVSITLHVYGNQKKYKLISQYKNYLISFLAPLCETSTCGGTPVQFRIRSTHCDVFISLWRWGRLKWLRI